jgi:hypothetical protein
MLMGDTRKVWGDWERRFVMLGRRKDDGADDVEEAMEDTIL